MLKVGVKVKDEATEYLRKTPASIDKHLVKALLQAAVHAEGELKQVISETFSSGGTGALSRNPKATLLESNGKIKKSGALMDLVYARIQDKGGTIRAKSGRNLAIPLSTEAKVPGKWPRTWAPGQLFFMKSKAGNKLLVERKGLKGIKPHYLLKPTVTLVGKGYVARALRQAKPKILEIVGNEVKLALKENL